MSFKKFIKMIKMDDYHKIVSPHDIMNMRTWLENIPFEVVLQNLDSFSAVSMFCWPRGNEGPNVHRVGSRLFTVRMKVDLTDPVIDIIKEG